MRFDFSRLVKTSQDILQHGMQLLKTCKEYIQSGKIKEHLDIARTWIRQSIAYVKSEQFRKIFTRENAAFVLQSCKIFFTRENLQELLQIAKGYGKRLSQLYRSGHFHPRNLIKLLAGTTKKNRITSTIALSFAVCAFGAAAVAPLTPDAADLPVKSVTVEIQLPTISDQITALSSEKQFFMREDRVRLGDTLGSLLGRLGIDDANATAFIKSDPTARAILQLRAGKLVQAKTDDSGMLYWLSVASADGKEVVVTRTESGFASSDVAADLERRIEMRSGTINSSLFAATDAAQIPDSVTSKFVDMFSTDIDFRADLRRGDHFNLVYETYWQNGTYVRPGRILAAEFVNAGRTYQAVWFDDDSSDQGGAYYTFEGKALKKAFLKSPLEFTRVSSGFGTRVHPISGKLKQHHGIDFAAPTGTPIRAAADGTIDFSGWRGGYGNFVVIRHWNPYSTAYGHMSRIASSIRRGTKVRQGDVIGYVGTTGYSTGPHLHYEFRVNNVYQNPRNFISPEARPLAGAELQRFRQAAAEMEHRFALMNPAAEKVAAR